MTPTEQVLGLLRRAAELCAAEGVGQEVFMTAAWNAVLDASPGLREKLADQQLALQLIALRERGLIGSA